MAKIATVVVLVAVCAFGLSTGMYMYNPTHIKSTTLSHSLKNSIQISGQIYNNECIISHWQKKAYSTNTTT